jgi:hypothetical protein
LVTVFFAERQTLVPIRLAAEAINIKSWKNIHDHWRRTPNKKTNTIALKIPYWVLPQCHQLKRRTVELLGFVASSLLSTS